MLCWQTPTPIKRLPKGVHKLTLMPNCVLCALPNLPAVQTPSQAAEISKFDGTVTELEKNLGLHDGIQAYLQLEYASGVAKAAIFKNADLSV